MEDKDILLKARDVEAQRNVQIRRFNTLTDRTPVKDWTSEDLTFMREFCSKNANELFYGGQGDTVKVG